MKDKLYKLMNWPEIEAIVYGEEGCPQDILGRHSVSTYTLFQTFQPDAKQVVLVLEDDAKEYDMELADEAGFFAIAIPRKIKGAYHYEVTDKKGKKISVHDPYDYAVPLKKDVKDKWSRGVLYNAGDELGSQVKTVSKTKGVLFRVWAPNAIRVSVVGSFNNWNGKSHPMMKDAESGIFSLFIPDIDAGTQYRYEISAKGGVVYTKEDPFAVSSKNCNSVVTLSKSFKWTDSDFEVSVNAKDKSKAPLLIYETELCSLIGKKGLDLKELDSLVADAKNACANYVQFIAYKDSAYGIMDGIEISEMKTIVDKLHANGIAVICDYNPCAFSMRDEGLGSYDGTYLYGHLDERIRYNLEFNGCNYNYSRPEVVSYLMSGAMYLMSEFHLDGLHINGLSSILFLDYGKYEEECACNIYGGHENLDAIEFIKHFNSIIHKEFPNAITTTREVCAFPRVTESLNSEGLGFDYIWNNGFSEDFHSFVKGDNAFKNISLLTDGMSYEYCENYLVTMSKADTIMANEYDELRVSNGAGYFDYVPLDDSLKPSLKRASLLFMMTRPGKKLIYRGQEDKKAASAFSELYKEKSALSSLDRNPYGFEWIRAINHGDGVVAFMRKDEYLDHSVLVVSNFSTEDYKEYKIGIPYEGKYKEIMTSDDKKFGGNSSVPVKAFVTEEEEYDGRESSLTLKLSPLTTICYAYTPFTEKELLEQAEKKVLKYKEQLTKEAKEKARELAKKTSK